MNDLYYLCQAGDLKPGEAKNFLVTTHEGNVFDIAVFNIDSKFYAISNTCRHKGGPLSKGKLEENIVTCPWHGWKYSVIDGKSPHEGGDSVDSYELQNERGKLYVN